MNQEELTALGRADAQRWVLNGRRRGKSLGADIRSAGASVSRMAAHLKGAKPLHDAQQWLFDNSYLSQQAAADAAAAFLRARRMPAVQLTEKVLRVLLTAQGFWAGCGQISGPMFAAYLEGVQSVQPLEEEELGLLIPALKGALVLELEAACRELTERPDEVLAQRLKGIFTALRGMDAAELSQLLEGLSAVDGILRQDPSGDYSRMEEGTRARYRFEVVRLARRSGSSQPETAQKVLDLARKSTGEKRHVGYYLFREPLGGPDRSHSGGAYITALLLPGAAVSLLVGLGLNCWWGGLLLFFPVFHLLKSVLDFCIVRLCRPRPVFRMDMESGVPEEGKTLCVITTILAGEGDIHDLRGKLERYALANRSAGRGILYGILADLPDSDGPVTDGQRKMIRRAAEVIKTLNISREDRFYLLFREPVYQARDERYLGWERKRGALLELAALLRGRQTGVRVLAGDRQNLSGVRYVITLDSDTHLGIDAAPRLVGAMLHPLNRPKVDRERRVVTSGYGLLQPRLSVELDAVSRSRFARIFAGVGGVDPYGGTSSDVYHDLMDEATFTGKGIFDVDAWLTCLAGRFPEQRVLSHDSLEGSYLHAGLVGDVELTDGYPSRAMAYFRRQHRWVRGDWQNVAWLMPRVRDQAGTWERNPISGFSRWKLLDNLRRSLTPVVTMLLLLLGIWLSRPIFTLAALLALISSASGLLLAQAEVLLRRGRGAAERYHSNVSAGLSGALALTAVQFVLLPMEAWINLTAIVTALWRSLISRKKCLEWTTAAEYERRAGGRLLSCIRFFWPSLAAGVLALMPMRFPAGNVAGLLWLSAPVFAWSLSLPQKGGRGLGREDRVFLLHEASLIWRYFDTYLRPEDHYLPPDNLQSEPYQGLARRTSPTNIGFALLGCLAALDLGLASRTRVLGLIDGLLTTVEGLEKWNGHLFNWYDTATALPLSPRFVSSVDSGNFCASLIALKEGLYALREAGLARRAAALAESVELNRLYDPKRKLFYIGYDLEQNAFSKSWYDLMASEARLLSYVAVARGDVGAKHWRTLSRMQTGRRGYKGMLSWTGTMFEYFMPHLLLPVRKNSLLYESLAFCACEQMADGEKRGIPWGVSESAYYAFDQGGSYRYRANGLQSLALKRECAGGGIIAPYAAFLTLMLIPRRAAANLRKLRALGMEGRFGLYEAADFSAGRGRPCMLVRSWMAHHLGMSLLALDNALRGEIMQRRFLSDPAMGAYEELLEERIPVSAPTVKHRGAPVPERRARPESGEWSRTGTGFDPGDPVCTLLHAGRQSMLFTAAGAGWFRQEGLELAGEMRIYLRTRQGLLPLFPRRSAGSELQWRLAGGAAALKLELDCCTVEQTAALGENGQLRRIALAWKGAQQSGELICAFQPMLAPERDYRAHPAYSKLGLESVSMTRMVLFRRRFGEEKGVPTLAVGWDRAEAWADSDWANLTGSDRRPPGFGDVPEMGMILRLPLQLRAGKREELRISLAAGEEKNAVRSAQIRLETPPGPGETAALARSLGLKEEQLREAAALLSWLEAPARPKVDAPVAQQRALWPFGISGDDPIVLLCCPSDGTERAKAAAREFLLLREMGQRLDLVLCLPPEEEGEAIRTQLNDLLCQLGKSHCLGGKQGLHLVSCSAEEREMLCAMAAVALPQGELLCQPRQFNLPARPTDVLPEDQKRVSCRWEEDVFVLECRDALPPVRWSLPLCNEKFGWLGMETGGGHLWYLNARENKLTPWENDPLARTGPESLQLERAGRSQSLFAALDGAETHVEYGLGVMRWERAGALGKTRLTAFVPPDISARVWMIEREECDRDAEFSWSLEPLMADARPRGRWVQCRETEQGVSCKNRIGNEAPGQTFVLLSSEPGVRTALPQRGEDRITLALPAAGRVILVAGAWLEAGEEENIRALLDWSRAERALEETRQYWRQICSPIRVCTPEDGLNHYLSGWSLYQTCACRLFARTSLYQCGGAYGFRDQLQDVCALMDSAPGLARRQILRCCAHQFEEGDVLHWWHPGSGGEPDRGVRTRITDDLLWLPYTVSRWLERTEHRALLEESVPYLSAPMLGSGEKERYFAPETSTCSGTVYDHCVRAIECSLGRGVGEHGLCLMGTGDWNDGMDRVGAQGRGESVWLTWFLTLVLRRFAPVAQARGETDRAQRYLALADKLARRAGDAWDGDWYRRGYYDSGLPLGSRQSAACQIDSIAQSFAAFAPSPDPRRTAHALDQAYRRLFDQNRGVVKLLSTPFSGAGEDPGYIRNYPAGVRENGGQYTHAAIWLAMALLQTGQTDRGWQILRCLLPEHHPMERYRGEPFVLAGDVCSVGTLAGRAGWTWYTGAAGWYYRAAAELLLGIQIRGGMLTLQPCLPAAWTGYEAELRLGAGVLQLIVARGSGAREMRLDGEPAGPEIDLSRLEGEHRLELML